MKTNTNKEKEADNGNPLSEMADTALKSYEQALGTGLKLQEETGRWWTAMASKSSTGQEWQKQFTAMTGVANSLVPLAQKRLEEVLELVESNGRANASLMKKAAEAAQTPVIADSQAKWIDFWTSSISASRTSAEAFAQIGTKAVDEWIDFIQKHTEVAEIRVPKAA